MNKKHIELSAAEIQSGLDRVKWAEGLIRQLPETHNGRNSWLLNYGAKIEKPSAEPPSSGCITKDSQEIRQPNASEGVDLRRYLNELKTLLRTASHEIERLRRANEIMSAQTHVIEIFGAAVLGKPPPQGYGPDVVWEIRRTINEMEKEAP